MFFIVQIRIPDVFTYTLNSLMFNGVKGYEI